MQTFKYDDLFFIFRNIYLTKIMSILVEQDHGKKSGFSASLFRQELALAAQGRILRQLRNIREGA